MDGRAASPVCLPVGQSLFQAWGYIQKTVSINKMANSLSVDVVCLGPFRLHMLRDIHLVRKTKSLNSRVFLFNEKMPVMPPSVDPVLLHLLALEQETC